MIRCFKSFYLIITLLGLNACGFSPLYMDKSPEGELSLSLSQISLSPIKGRSGQLFSTNLEDKLAPFGPASFSAYSLNITINESQEGYGFRTDEAVTRENSRIDVVYNLIENSTGKVLTSGNVRSDMAYDIVQSDFANTQVRKDASLRNIGVATVKLSTILALYFKKNFPINPGVK